MDEIRRHADRSRLVRYPNAPNAATNSAVAPPACHRIAGLVVAY